MITLTERFEVACRFVVPFGIALGLLVIAYLPKAFDGMNVLTPAFAPICVYYWSVYYPSTLPYWAVFLLGLLQDALYGLPLGVSSAALIVLRFVIVSQRKLFSRKGFLPLWGAFTVISLAVFAVSWIAVCLYYRRIEALDAPLMQWLATAAVYPLIHGLILTPVYTYLPRTS